MKRDTLQRANEIHRDMESVLQKIEKLKTALNILTDTSSCVRLNIIGNTYSVELDNLSGVYAVNNNIKNLEKSYKRLAGLFEQL